MLAFHASEPYPLIGLDGVSYTEIQMHSEAVDRWLGLRVEEVEYNLSKVGCRSRAPGSAGEHQQLWFGLASRSLLTPYVEIRTLLAGLAPKSGSTVVDLGAGYGRMGFVVARHHPAVKFIGYEYVGERVNEARRCLAKLDRSSISMVHADLSAPGFSPEPADFYFMYDYGTQKAIEKTLHDLRRISKTRPITIIGRGRHCRMAIESRHYWLAKKNPLEPEGRATVYVSDPSLIHAAGPSPAMGA